MMGIKNEYLPLSLQYEVVEEYEKSDILDMVEHDRICFSLNGEPLVSLTPAELYNKLLVLAYEETGSGYTAKLKLEGEVLAEGNPVLPGTTETFGMYVESDGEGTQVDNDLLVGGIYQITVDTQSITERELAEASEKLTGLQESVTQENVLQEEYLGVLLDFAGKAYFAQVDMTSRFLAEELDMVFSRSLSVGMTGYRPDGSLMIDIDHDCRVIPGAYENAGVFTFLSGIASSAYEHQIWEQIAGVSSVSTMSVFEEAGRCNVPLKVLTKDNWDSMRGELSIGAGTLSDMEGYIRDGKMIIVPEKEVPMGDWRGCGYIVLDPVTCTGQYLIAGGLVAVDGASVESSLNGGVTSKKVDAAMLTSVIMTAEDIASSILLFYHVGMWILSAGGIFGILGLLVAGVVLYQLLSLSMMCYIENASSKATMRMEIWLLARCWFWAVP